MQILISQKIFFIVILKKEYLMQWKIFFPIYINIKYCIWHYKRLLMTKKNYVTRK